MMDDGLKRKLILGVGFVAILYFLYFVFVMGASFGCGINNGTLLVNSDGLSCVDVSVVDVCRDYTGRVVERVDPFNFSVNMTDFDLGDV